MFNDLGSLLPQAVKRAGINKQVDSAKLIELAEETLREQLSPEVAKELKPAFIQNGQLAIAALSPIAAQELQFREQEVIEKVNKKTGRQAVKRLKYLT